MLTSSPTYDFKRTDTAHVVRLFDSDRSIADRVAEFVCEGYWRSEQILVVIKGDRWKEVAMRLSALDCPIDDAMRFGRVIVRDVNDTLKKFMVRDKPHGRLFAATVGALVEGQAAFRRPVRIYGEMVDELVSRGRFKAALELEELWNELATRHRFTLLCGYTAWYFGDRHNAADLRGICAAHSAVAVDPEDVLASFLVNRLDAA